VVRNDCLWALHYLPWLAVCVNLPVRLARYFLMKRGSQVRDPGGFFWIVRELILALPGVFRTRTPLTWSDLAEWRRLLHELYKEETGLVPTTPAAQPAADTTTPAAPTSGAG